MTVLSVKLVLNINNMSFQQTDRNPDVVYRQRMFLKLDFKADLIQSGPGADEAGQDKTKV